MGGKISGFEKQFNETKRIGASLNRHTSEAFRYYSNLLKNAFKILALLRKFWRISSIREVMPDCLPQPENKSDKAKARAPVLIWGTSISTTASDAHGVHPNKKASLCPAGCVQADFLFLKNEKAFPCKQKGFLRFKTGS